MAQTAGFGTDWLPQRVQRNMAAEAQREAQEAREAERDREARREARRDGALSAYRSQAEGRGEVISAMQLATGQGLGRSMEDIRQSALAAADREDARQASRDRREDTCYIDAEPMIHSTRSDNWPSSEYELGRQLRQAAELHRDLVARQARADYPAAVRTARDKSTGQAQVTRAGSPYREITRVTPS